jgi:predicted secreted protein
MNRFSILFLFSIVTAVLFSACEKKDSQTFLITEKDINQLIVLEVGDKLDVNLEGNPSTGYGWEMVPVQGAVLSQIGDVDFHASSLSAGSPGRVTLHFKAVNQGRQELELVYRRPWEGDTLPLMVYKVELEVK